MKRINVIMYITIYRRHKTKQMMPQNNQKHGHVLYNIHYCQSAFAKNPPLNRYKLLIFIQLKYLFPDNL